MHWENLWKYTIRMTTSYQKWLNTNLMDENMCSTWAQEQDSSSESVPVAVELLCAHGGEQTWKHATDVPIHSLQRHV